MAPLLVFSFGFQLLFCWADRSNWKHLETVSLQRKLQWVSSTCSSHCGHIHTAFLRGELGRSHWDKPQGCLTLLTSWFSTVWKFILSCPSRWKLPEHHSPCFVPAPYPSYLGCPSVKESQAQRGWSWSCPAGEAQLQCSGRAFV